MTDVNPYDLMPGDPDLHNLYRRSATFHHTMNMLANMIPAMVEGLAARCGEADAAHEMAVHVAETTPAWMPIDERDPRWRDAYESAALPRLVAVDGDEWRVLPPETPSTETH